jgi:predicted acetyltransferase
MAELIAPTARLAETFRDALDEYTAEGRGGPDDYSLTGGVIRYYREHPDPFEAAFAAYLERSNAMSEAPLPAGFVPQTTYWWVEDDTFLGRISVRHRLNDHLREVGGHIGYDMRPTARRRGHATAMLAAALPRAADLGIDKALITCDTGNIGSKRVIERNGGVFEDERHGKLRYWVPTAP